MRTFAHCIVMCLCLVAGVSFASINLAELKSGLKSGDVVESLIYSAQVRNNNADRPPDLSPKVFYQARWQSNNFVIHRAPTLEELTNGLPKSGCGTVSNCFWQMNDNFQLTIHEVPQVIQPLKLDVAKNSESVILSLLNLGFPFDLDEKFQRSGNEFSRPPWRGQFLTDAGKVNSCVLSNNPNLYIRMTYGEEMIGGLGVPTSIRRDVIARNQGKEVVLTTTTWELFELKLRDKRLPDAYFSPDVGLAVAQNQLYIHSTEGVNWYDTNSSGPRLVADAQGKPTKRELPSSPEYFRRYFLWFLFFAATFAFVLIAKSKVIPGP